MGLLRVQIFEQSDSNRSNRWEMIGCFLCFSNKC